MAALAPAVALVGFLMLAVGAVVYVAALRRAKTYEAAREAAAVEHARAEAFKAQAQERADAIARTAERIRELEELLSREKEKKDTGPILEQLVEQGRESSERQIAIMKAFSRHEARAIERQEGVMTALHAVVDKLNGA